MADVTEVIHKITYEVNDEALQNVTRAIQQQIIELTRLSRRLDIYRRQLASTSRAEVQEIERLSGLIEGLNNKIGRSAAKFEGAIKQIGTGIIKGLGIDSEVDKAVSGFTENLVKGLSDIDDFSFTSLGNLAKNLLSFTNIAPLAISFLANLAVNLFNAGKGADAAEKSYKEYLETLKKNRDNTLRSIDEEIGQANININTVRDQNRSEKDRQGAAAQLKAEYEAIYRNYSIQQIANGQTEEANENLLKQIEYYKTSQLNLKNAVEARERLRTLEEEELAALKKKNDVQAEYDNFVKNKFTGSEYSVGIKDDLATKISNAQKEYQDAQDRVDRTKFDINFFEQRASEYASASPDLSYPTTPVPIDTSKPTYTPDIPKPDLDKKPEIKLDFSLKEPTDAEIKELSDQIVESMTNEVEQQLKRQLEDIDGIEVWLQQNVENLYNNDEINYKEYQERKTKISQDAAIARLTHEEATAYKKVEIAETDEQKEEAKRVYESAKLKTISARNKYKHSKEGEDPEEKQSGLTDKQRENIKTGIEGYQKLAEAAAEAYNTILEAQINALDREIIIREKRVAAASKLAEKGNAETLRIEEQRLRAAEKQREEAARKQILVNRALAISSSIAAVANAALAGDGYTAAARVIAIVTALAAAIAQVSALASESSPSFAEGVVDFRGKGGPKDDKNWVRISSGESVITADATQKNRNVLEAMNKGVVFRMIDPRLPLYLPSFKDVRMQGNHSAGTDLKGLSVKLDKVVDAIEDNKLKQNIFFDEHGVGIMTERAINRNRRRWK